MGLYVQYAKRSIWNSTEHAEKAIGAPESTWFTSERRRGTHYSADKRIKDLRMKYLAPLDTTSEASQSKVQAIGM